ncbi:hypothetical protein Micbo1qcDRAFT_234045 [Microdochium bolleyi]|uniref:Uncharacterized protein n=1 Tax=Microdochium bolleyi TaxID=196109 RepID=A0A136J2U8_9PEZI|nr:hypothetical protein Micbo1qcDRAFT_234045 [Microdochium bolleyi]
MGRPEEAGDGTKNPFSGNGRGEAPQGGGDLPSYTHGSGDDMTSMGNQINNDTKTDINSHAYTSRSTAGGDFGDDDSDLPPGYSPAAGGNDASLPPAYGADSNVAGAVAPTIEPLSLVISGHFIYSDPGNPAGETREPPPSAPPIASAGPALYSMNRGISSLSHSDRSVNFERLDHSVRQTGSAGGNSTAPRVVQRSRHIFDLRHFDDQTAKFHASPLKGYKHRVEGAGEDDGNIPRFYCQATSRRSLGSFGLQQVKIRGSGFSALKGSEQGYDVLPLARRKAEHDTPHFAFGEKGKGLAKPMFTVRLKPVDGGSGTASSSGGGGGLFGKGKGKAEVPVLFWEWLNEFGQVVAREDMAWRGVLPDTHVQGQTLPQLDTSGIPQLRQCHRLVTTTSLAREAFDVLVSSWCLRVWWESADNLGPTNTHGIRRSLFAAQEYGIGMSNSTWGFALR